MKSAAMTYRQEISPLDLPAIRTLVTSSGYFSAEEVGVAVELLEERLLKGDASGYFFLLAEQETQIAGYTCFGPIPGARTSFDLYWIAVDNHLRHGGIGKELLEKTEILIHTLGGDRIYVETSSRPQYENTVAFYQRCGYGQAALLDDFYAPGDGKIILVKVLNTTSFLADSPQNLHKNIL